MKNNLKLQDVYTLREWMPFSDKEISMFQLFFVDYFLENENNLSKKDVYKLGCLSQEVQYQIRLLKARISGDTNIDEQSNNRFIEMLMSFDGLIEFVRDKIIESFDNTSIDNRYEIIQQPYSYFAASDEIRERIKEDFDNYFKN